MTTHLYLARHGQTHWNQIHRFQGQLDSNLTETGKQQSANIAHQLGDKKIDFIVSSTLGRALHTASICQSQLNAPIINSNQLIERDLGHWQGLYVNDVKTDEHYNELLHQFTTRVPKNGESAVSCAARIYQTLENLGKKHVNKNVLVIFHG
jgi:broad specificity phosphatase PhoE